MPLPAALILFLALPYHGFAILVNRTIDDEFGDPITGIMPVYNPSGVWVQGSKCLGCAAQPSPNLAFNGTWHDSTYFASQGGDAHSIAISFNGSAIYVFFITVPIININNPDTHLNISLDGQPSYTYNYQPDSSSPYLYNQSVYSNSNLDGGQHTLLVSSGGVTSSTLLFDYAIYTVDVDSQQSTSTVSLTTSSTRTSASASALASTPASTSRKSSLGTIIGIVLGGLAVILIISLLLVRRRRGRKTYHGGETEYIPLSAGYRSQGETTNFSRKAFGSNKASSVPIWSESEDQEQTLEMQGYMSPALSPRSTEISQLETSLQIESDIRRAELRRRQETELEMTNTGLKRAVTQVHYPGQ